MLILGRELFKQVISQCLSEFPDEACGIFAGKGGKVTKVFESANVDRSPSTYLMEPKEQLKIMKKIRNSKLEMVGIYHSHIASEAYPSRKDMELAFYPDVSCVIISLKDKDNPCIRSFKIREGRIIEEEVKIE